MSKSNTEISVIDSFNDAVIIKPVISTASTYNAYITTEIGEAVGYVNFVEILYAAEESDIVNLYLNTPGGNMHTAMMIINAILETKATVIAYLTGEVCSAGTMIALVCDTVVPLPYSSFMIHSYSIGTYGKAHEIGSKIDFYYQLFREFAEDIYIPFLSADELAAVMRGEDRYFSAAEVAARWATVLEYRSKTVEMVADTQNQDSDEVMIAALKDKGYKVTKPKALSST